MSKKTCIPTDGRTNASVVENIYGIIDSKIQYLDYQAKELVRPLIGENTTTLDSGIPKSDSPDIILKLKEQWFLAFEKYSKMKKRLLVLRNALDKDNALIILSLLTDDQLVKISQKELNYRLGIMSRIQAA